MINRQIPPELPGVSYFMDRHGKIRWRYRNGKTTVNLGSDYGSPEFIRRYTEAINDGGLPKKAPPPRRAQKKRGQHPLSELIDRWYRSSQFRHLQKSTATNYECAAERLRSIYGALPIEALTRRDVQLHMQKKSYIPASANLDLQVLRLMLDYAIQVEEWIEANPARQVKNFAVGKKGGIHTWTEAEIAQFRLHWPEGSMADLAIHLMLYTGAARVDAVKLGPANLRGAGKRLRLSYSRQKLASRRGKGGEVDIPVHPELARRLVDIPAGQTTFLLTAYGNKFAAAGLGEAVKTWCGAAGIPHCSSHELRKACARRLAEAGATAHEIMAVTGHATISQVDIYTAEARRSTLANSAIDRLT